MKANGLETSPEDFLLGCSCCSSDPPPRERADLKDAGERSTLVVLPSSSVSCRVAPEVEALGEKE